MLGLAGLAFAACSNDDEVSNFDNGEKQSVVIKIGNEATSRTLGDSQAGLGGQAGNLEDGTAIKLSNVTIFYAQGTNIVKSVKLSSTDTEKWDALTNAGYVEHNLPSAVNQVYIAGNYAGDLSKVATKGALEATVVQASKQQDVNNIVLYGVDESLENAGAADNLGHEKVLKAVIELKPLISRIEIKGIQCEDLGNQFSSIELKAIGLMNVSQEVTLGGTAGDDLTLTNVNEPGQTGKDFTFGSADFWAWDQITGVTLNQATDTYPTDQQVYGYNFIAKNEQDLQVKLYLAAKKGDAVTPLNNTITANFGEKKFEPGMIYQVTLKFKEENIGPWDPSQTQCIQVNVTVQKWEVETLTPQYQ